MDCIRRIRNRSCYTDVGIEPCRTFRHHPPAIVRSHLREKLRHKEPTRYSHSPPHECFTSPIGWRPRLPGAFERITPPSTSPSFSPPGTLHTALPMSLRDNFRTKRRELKALLLPSPSPDPQARIASSSTNTQKTILGAIQISLELTEKLSEELPPLQMTVKVLGTVLDMYVVCPTVSKSAVWSNVPQCAFVHGM